MLYVILDLNKHGWQSLTKPQTLVNEIATFINIFKKSSTSNEIKILNNKKEVALGNLNFAESDIFADLGYAICKGCDRALLIVVSSKIDVVRCVKVQHAAQKFKVRVDVLSPHRSAYLEQLAAATKGLFLDRDVIGFFGSRVACQSFYPATCRCHDKEVLLGLVCPVCLAVYCRFIPICKSCKTKFRF